jgi:hypothetical protein
MKIKINFIENQISSSELLFSFDCDHTPYYAWINQDVVNSFYGTEEDKLTGISYPSMLLEDFEYYANDHEPLLLFLRDIWVVDESRLEKDISVFV